MWSSNKRLLGRLLVVMFLTSVSWWGATNPMPDVRRDLDSTTVGYSFDQGQLLPTPLEPVVVERNDSIYRSGGWDSSPIVLEEYRLIFFSVPKVACTTFKQLFRKVKGFENWQSQNPNQMLPHNPKTNGLTYLSDYSTKKATRMMNSPNYTRAIFVRDPKSRVLSAWADKGLGNFHNFMQNKCCKETGDCVKQATTFPGFLTVIQNCSDAHWRPQYHRMEPKFWPYINFVGHMENLQVDGPALLQRVGLWEEFGATGYGPHGNLSIFDHGVADMQNHVASSSHPTKEDTFTPELESLVEEYYREDYDFAPFGFHQRRQESSL
eukprot:Nitzschia sp. Nitz4//scaffold50_size126154//17706//18671//NITZ4_003671-RA/size126154-processed-gene-0.29-mRNA-1//1//CDS//3329553656//7479//frame0